MKVGATGHLDDLNDTFASGMPKIAFSSIHSFRHVPSERHDEVLDDVQEPQEITSSSTGAI